MTAASLATVGSAVAAVTDRLASWDWAASPPHGIAALVWTVLALPGARWVTLPVMAIVVGAQCRQQRRLTPAAVGVVLLAVLTVVVLALKWMVGRAAPGAMAGDTGMSFPSGHVVNAVVAWGMVGLVRRHTPRAALRLGCLTGGVVAIAAIALGWHWTTDAVAGAALGVFLLAAWLAAIGRLQLLQSGPGPRSRDVSSAGHLG
jgi:undecaprenyl-diphosphatase